MKMAIIYRATCKVTGKLYIGQSQQSLRCRRMSHESTARQGVLTAFASAIRKYGAEAFEWEILDQCAPADLNEREIALIAEHDTMCPNGYNIAIGGVGKEVHKKHRRKLEEDADLPQHISRLENPTGGKGYRVQMPDGRKKAFISMYYTAAEKLAMAVEWLERALADPEYTDSKRIRKSKEDNALPTGVTLQASESQVEHITM